MNYGICSNGSRDTGYETAIKTAKILIDLGATPVFETGMAEECPALNDIAGVVFADFAQTNIKTIKANKHAIIPQIEVTFIFFLIGFILSLFNIV